MSSLKFRLFILLLTILIGLFGTYSLRTFKQYNLTKNKAESFLELLARSKYRELDEYLDLSKIKMADIEKYGEIASKRYYQNAIYQKPRLAFAWNQKNILYVTGWKYRRSKGKNDLWLFVLRKERTDWKIISIQPMIDLSE